MSREFAETLEVGHAAITNFSGCLSSLKGLKPEVEVEEGENIENALRRFRRMVNETGNLRRLRQTFHDETAIETNIKEIRGKMSTIITYFFKSGCTSAIST